MKDREQLDYWRDQMFKIQKIIQLLKSIKRDMNIQDPKKVIERYIKNQDKELKEAIECYEFYLGEEVKNESIV